MLCNGIILLHHERKLHLVLDLLHVHAVGYAYPAEDVGYDLLGSIAVRSKERFAYRVFDFVDRERHTLAVSLDNVKICNGIHSCIMSCLG